MTERPTRFFEFPLGRRESPKRGVYVVRYSDGSVGDETPVIPDIGVFRARLIEALGAWMETKAGRRAATARKGRITIRHLSRMLNDEAFRPSLLSRLKQHGILTMEIHDYDEAELVADWFIDDDLLPKTK